MRLIRQSSTQWDYLFVGTEAGSFRQNAEQLIRISPNQGILNPHEKTNVKITLAARQQVKKSEKLSLFVQFCQVKADTGKWDHLENSKVRSQNKLNTLFVEFGQNAI